MSTRRRTLTDAQLRAIQVVAFVVAGLGLFLVGGFVIDKLP